MTLAVAVANACAGGLTAQITAQSTGSPYFSLSRPAIYASGGGFQLVGRVCRRARITLLSPPRVRLEHVAPSGDVVDAGHTAVATIYGRADQACADYALHVAWQIGDGDSVRACFDRGRACPADPADKAAITVPTSPVAPR